MTWRFIIIISCFSYCVCGELNDSNLRITSGNKVDDRKLFPYQVSVRVQGEHRCGGTIIDKKHVLTAAVCCFFTADDDKMSSLNMEVYAGNLKLNDPSSTTQERRVSCVLPHADYNKKTNANNIALLRVYSDFEFNEYVKPLPLSSGTPTEGGNCVISGWGSLEKGSTKASEDLMSLSVPIISDFLCKELVTPEGLFCAGSLTGEGGACYKDFGNPLVCKETTIAGIIVKPHSCTTIMALTDVSYFQKWIESEKKCSCPWETWEIVLLIVGLIILVLLIILIYWLSRKYCCD